MSKEMAHCSRRISAMCVDKVLVVEPAHVSLVYLSVIKIMIRFSFFVFETNPKLTIVIK